VRLQQLRQVGLHDPTKVDARLHVTHHLFRVYGVGIRGTSGEIEWVAAGMAVGEIYGSPCQVGIGERSG
jgi:hypothetical protein